MGVAWAVMAAAYLLLVLWAPTHALRTAWGIVLLGALRSQTLSESRLPQPSVMTPA